MAGKKSRNDIRKKRHYRLRKNLAGTADRPRLSVFRSINHIYAQLIDDTAGRTLLAASSLDKELKERLTNGGNIEAARAVGQRIAELAVARGIKRVVFDRGGFLYHGRVAGLADAARAAGLEF
ncbi:MAG: 50S ribosomal protein L18 [Negativicutes bacterium]|nr:50S ribosomal protein L18 [Negativicutes bacterium]